MMQFYQRFLTSIALLILIYLSIINTAILLITLLFLTFQSMKEFNFMYKNIFKKNSKLIFLSNFLSVIYLSFFSILVWIYLNSNTIEQEFLFVFLLSICAFTDIGGFIFGKLIGGKKLSKISPNKTYSGMIGSFFLAIVFGSLIFSYQKNIFDFEINVLLIIIAVSFVSQLGDLIISSFKRKAKIKDTGNILPGHGGILDRIDGMLVAIPFGILLISM